MSASPAVERLIAATKGQFIAGRGYRRGVFSPIEVAKMRKIALCHGIDFPVPKPVSSGLRPRPDKGSLALRHRPDRLKAIQEGLAQQTQLYEAYRKKRLDARKALQETKKSFKITVSLIPEEVKAAMAKAKLAAKASAREKKANK